MTQSDFLMNIVDKKNLINENTLNFKEKDYAKIIDILSIICKSIEVIPEIVFERIELLDDEYENEKMIRTIPIENSRVIKIRIHFKLVDENRNIIVDEKTGKELRPTIDLLIPRLINGSFILSDVTYYAMLQILDYKSLVKENKSLVKTLINKMEIEIKKNRKKQNRVEIDVFNRKEVPMWLVLFSILDPIEAMKSVFKIEDIRIGSLNDGSVDEDLEDEELIIIQDKYIKLNGVLESIKRNEEYSFSISIMLEALKEFLNNKVSSKFLDKYISNTDAEELMRSNEIFIEMLGSYYSSNSNKFLAKGMNVVHSLNRFLDDISKSYMGVENLLDMFMNELERINKHNIALKNNDQEAIENNMANNLLNKRVRMSEYIIFSFTKKLSDNMHIVLNSNTKDDIRMNKIQNIFKINKNIIIKSLLTNNLVRYNDQSNQMSAIASTKASFIASESSKNIPDSLKSVPASGLGRIDLITTPTGSSVGLTFNLSATNPKLVDEKGIII